MELPTVTKKKSMELEYCCLFVPDCSLLSDFAIVNESKNESLPLADHVTLQESGRGVRNCLTVSGKFSRSCFVHCTGDCFILRCLNADDRALLYPNVSLGLPVILFGVYKTSKQQTINNSDRVLCEGFVSTASSLHPTGPTFINRY